jgi:hypothetical protein
MSETHSRLAGSTCCVAIGIASAEYGSHLAPRSGQPVNAYGATGGANSVGAPHATVVNHPVLQSSHPCR